MYTSLFILIFFLLSLGTKLYFKRILMDTTALSCPFPNAATVSNQKQLQTCFRFLFSLHIQIFNLKPYNCVINNYNFKN